MHCWRRPIFLVPRVSSLSRKGGHPDVQHMLTMIQDFLLALCPPDIDPASLSVMVAFAVGGLLGDTLFHLLPEIFLGEEPADSVRFVLVEPNRNLLLGLAIMIGFLTFVVMDKALRIASGGEGGHDHGHSHAGEPATAVTTGSKGKDKGDKGLKKRKSTPALAAAEPAAPPTTARDPSAQLGGILNMAADFTHNITDGLALASSFYASPAVGATTTVAVFFHEIPHEVGDFALLVRAGFSKRRAMGAQFITAVGAFLGTLLGIAIQEGLFTPSAAGGTGDAGLFGTSLTAGDLLLPFTAGTFLYVGTVAVVPELLETPPPAGGSADRGWRLHEAGKAGRQLVAVAFGAGIMLW